MRLEQLKLHASLRFEQVKTLGAMIVCFSSNSSIEVLQESAVRASEVNTWRNGIERVNVDLCETPTQVGYAQALHLGLQGPECVISRVLTV